MNFYIEIGFSDMTLISVSFCFIFVSDIDECSEDPESCHENANCANTPGSFVCSCLPGYEGDGIDSCTGT